jgi:uncharacterized protein YukE
MGQGFSVNTSTLQAGSHDVTGLQEIWNGLAGNAVQALASMAGSAGDAGLASALTGAAGRGDRAFTGLSAAYGHVSSTLTSNAASYSTSDQQSAAIINAIGHDGTMLQP